MCMDDLLGDVRFEAAAAPLAQQASHSQMCSIQ
jgi:hypothetical protein